MLLACIGRRQRPCNASAADAHVDQWHLNGAHTAHNYSGRCPVGLIVQSPVSYACRSSDNSFCAASMRSSSLSVKDTLHLSSVALCDACNTVMDDTSRHQRSIQPILSSAVVLFSFSSSSSRLWNVFSLLLVRPNSQHW